MSLTYTRSGWAPVMEDIHRCAELFRQDKGFAPFGIYLANKDYYDLGVELGPHAYHVVPETEASYPRVLCVFACGETIPIRRDSTLPEGEIRAE